MMNDKQIQIKERSRGYFTKGIFFLILMTVSLLYAFYPILSSREVSGVTYFYALGGGAFAIFTGFFVFLLYKEFKPDNAFILNAHGFTDIYNVGKEIEIEWTNVASVKIMGKNEAPFLGISLEDNDIVMSKMAKNKAEIMRENIEEGLPSILVSQSDVRTPVSELKDMFSKFIREARILEKDTAKKQKANPFTTDDVLRAFGQLPKENEEATVDTEESAEKIQQEIAEDVIENTIVVETVNTETDTATNAEIIEQLLVPEQTNENEVAEEVVEAEEETLDEEMPQEIKDILARAKSSKITELEKMLSDNQEFIIDSEPESDVADVIESKDDVDVTPVVETADDAEEIVAFEEIVEENVLTELSDDVVNETNQETVDEVIQEAEEEVIEEDVSEVGVEDTEAENIDNDVIRTNIPNLHFPDEFYTEKDSMGDTQEFNFEMNLESMLNNAFESEEADSVPTFDFTSVGEITDSDTDVESFSEDTDVEQETEQELEFDIFTPAESDDTDDTDDSDGELGFITDLD